jgi:hypothetical protein
MEVPDGLGGKVRWVGSVTADQMRDVKQQIERRAARERFRLSIQAA